jgi:hypothetical protein
VITAGPYILPHHSVNYHFLLKNMDKCPEDCSLVVRTTFEDNAAWVKIKTALEKKTVEGFQANLYFYSMPVFNNSSIADVKAAVLSAGLDFCFIVDKASLVHPENAILALDCEEGRYFRVIPAEVWSVENNLSICNMEFADFLGAVDGQNVFRGF